jgi:hypothetical protein
MLEELHHTSVVHKQQHPMSAEPWAPNQEGSMHGSKFLEIDV